MLLLLGANVDARNNHGLTPLHLAVCDGKAQCVKALIDGGADVNATSRLESQHKVIAIFCCSVIHI